jgi:hypothetical protein
MLAGSLAGCGGAEFGESVSIPQERHASLVDDFADGQELNLPGDMPFNLYDSQRRATGAGLADSSAEPAGRAGCQAQAGAVGTAEAEFQLGHVLDNRGQEPLKITARFAVDYACQVEADLLDRTKTADQLGLRVFVRDSNRRVLSNMMLTQLEETTGPREWTGRQVNAFDVTMEPGLAYYFVLAGRVSVTATELSTASAQIEVHSLDIELTPRQ